MSLASTTLMATEAAEAAIAVAALLQANRSELSRLGEWLRDQSPSLILTCARGSSDHAATYGKYLLETLAGVPVASAAPSISSVYGAKVEGANALVLAISQSGSSPDLLAVIEAYKGTGATIAALVNVEESPLAKLGDFLLPLCAGSESSVAATKSFIASLAIQAAIAAQWSGDISLATALEGLPRSLEAIARLRPHRLPAGLEHGGSLFVLGRGLGFGIAQEAALKFKETCALHAEAFSAAEVRHGPMAIVDDGFPVLAFATSDMAGESVRGAVREFAERGARVELIDALDLLVVEGVETSLAELAGHPALEPILMIQSFYFLVNDLALARGLDPDNPRFLRKVTLTR